MDLAPGQQLLGKAIDVVFIGSCTNSRITDLRQAAQFMQGRKVADSVRMMVVPGSQQVKKQAEQRGTARDLPGRRALSGAKPVARCASP